MVKLVPANTDICLIHNELFPKGSRCTFCDALLVTYSAHPPPYDEYVLAWDGAELGGVDDHTVLIARGGLAAWVDGRDTGDEDVDR